MTSWIVATIMVFTVVFLYESILRERNRTLDQRLEESKADRLEIGRLIDTIIHLRREGFRPSTEDELRAPESWGITNDLEVAISRDRARRAGAPGLPVQPEQPEQPERW